MVGLTICFLFAASGLAGTVYGPIAFINPNLLPGWMGVERTRSDIFKMFVASVPVAFVAIFFAAELISQGLDEWTIIKSAAIAAGILIVLGFICSLNSKPREKTGGGRFFGAVLLRIAIAVVSSIVCAVLLKFFGLQADHEIFTLSLGGLIFVLTFSIINL